MSEARYRRWTLPLDRTNHGVFHFYFHLLAKGHLSELQILKLSEWNSPISVQLSGVWSWHHSNKLLLKLLVQFVEIYWMLFLLFRLIRSRWRARYAARSEQFCAPSLMCVMLCMLWRLVCVSWGKLEGIQNPDYYPTFTSLSRCSSTSPAV